MTHNQEPTTRTKAFETTQLLELFRHLDTRVSHQELLYVPLSGALLAATLASWDKLQDKPWVVFSAAIASVCVYLLHLITIRRLAVFQKKIFQLLEKNHISEWDLVMNQSNGVLGVQVARMVGLPVLAGVWCGVCLNVSTLKTNPEWFTLACVALFVFALLVTIFLHGATDKKT
jgi:peptidoglycan/LPS O-acetylase OafA/YrhL